jgi:monoterpene epsilon-lactone hydrolase
MGSSTDCLSLNPSRDAGIVFRVGLSGSLRMETALSPTQNSDLSAQARTFLANPRQTVRDRTLQTLPSLRAEMKEYAVREAPRLLKRDGISIEDTTIGGVRCLVAHPPMKPTAWPILYGFGGGFVQGSPMEDLSIIAPLCLMSGARVVIPDYRLAPEHPWPAAIDDGFTVYKIMSGQPFAMVGASAGGNLILQLMLRAKASGLALPGAAAVLSPWCDIANTGDSLTFNEGRDPVLAVRQSNQAARLYAGTNPLDDPALSPLYGTYDTRFPPLLITTGTRDLLLSQSVRLAQNVREGGVSVDLQVWEGLWHVFEWYDELPESRRSMAQIAAFISKTMVG